MDKRPIVCLLLLLIALRVLGQGGAGLDLSGGKNRSDTVTIFQENLSEKEITQRLQDLRHLLDQNEKHAANWWAIWVGIYGGATLVQGTVAVVSDDRGTRQDMILGAGTTLLGFAGQLLTPVKSAYQATDLTLSPNLTMGERLEKLHQAEELLREQSQIAKAGKNWQVHALSGGVNLASGLITWIGFKRTFGEGMANFLLNTAVTEIQIWTQPVKAQKDYNRYSSKYGLTVCPLAKRPAVEWYAHVRPNGIGLGLGF